MSIEAGSVSIRQTANQIQLLLQEKTNAARVKHYQAIQRNLKTAGSKRKEPQRLLSTLGFATSLQSPLLATGLTEVSQKSRTWFAESQAWSQSGAQRGGGFQHSLLLSDWQTVMSLSLGSFYTLLMKEVSLTLYLLVYLYHTSSIRQKYFCSRNQKPDILYFHSVLCILKTVIITQRHIYFYDGNTQSSKQTKSASQKTL